MTKTVNTNYQNIPAPGNTFDNRISADTDTFSRNDIDALGNALDLHDHSSGKGLSVGTIQSTLIVAGASVTIQGSNGALYLTGDQTKGLTWDGANVNVVGSTPFKVTGTVLVGGSTITIQGSNGMVFFDGGQTKSIGYNGTSIIISGANVNIASIGAFVSGDKYLVVDSSGNVHKSATGPAS